jgi:hypothetical protein
MTLNLHAITKKGVPDSSRLVDISDKKWYISDSAKDIDKRKRTLPTISKIREQNQKIDSSNNNKN